MIVGDKPVSQWVKEWQGVAVELGDADAEKAALETKLTRGTTPAEAVKARNTCIRVVNAVLSMVALDAPDEATRTTLLGPLESALAKAARRAKPGVLEEPKGGGTSGTEPPKGAA